MPDIIIKPGPKHAPVMTMITRGRRALGESWRKINVYPDEETGGYSIENEETEAPADNNPIFVPGLGNISIEMADFILERSRDAAKDRAKKPKQSPAEVEADINAAWFDFMEQKLRMFKGQSTFGAAGSVERQGMRYVRQ